MPIYRVGNNIYSVQNWARQTAAGAVNTAGYTFGVQQRAAGAPPVFRLPRSQTSPPTEPDVAGPLSVDLDPAILTLSAQDAVVAGTGTASVTLDPAALTLTAQDVVPQGAASLVTLDVAQLTFTPQELVAGGSGSSARALDIAGLTLSAQELTAGGSGAAAVTLDPAALTLSPQELAAGVIAFLNQLYFPFTGTNGDPWPSGWTTIGGTATIQGGRGQLSATSGYNSSTAHTTGVDIADVRVTGTFRVGNLDEQYPAIGIRHNGAWNGGLVDDGIILYLGILENQIDLQVVLNGAYDSSVGAGASITWAANTDYRFTIEAIEGTGVTTVRAKVWPETSYNLEPDDWMIDGATSVAGRPASGGVSVAMVSGAGSTCTIAVDNIIIQDYDDDRLRVLPVGDSLTAGPYNFPGGTGNSTWRRYVYEHFESTLTPLQMVGQNWSDGVADGSGVLGTYGGLGSWDHDHLARNSWETSDVDAVVAADVENYQPDVAVLLIGINDILNGATPAATATEVGNIITAMRAEKSDILFVLCLQTPVPSEAADVATYNAALTSLAGTMTSGPSPVRIADLHTGFDEAWLYDGLHFDDDGDQFVADRIIAAMEGTDPLFVDLDPAALTFTPQELTVSATGAAATTLDIANLALSAQELSPTGAGTVSVTADIATLTLTPQELAISFGVATRTLDIAALTFTPQELTAGGTGTVAVTLDIAALTLSPQEVAASGAGVLGVSVDTPVLTLAPQELVTSTPGIASVTLDAAILALTPQELQIAGGTVLITLDPAVLSLAAQELTAAAAGTASVTLDPAVLALAPQELTAGGSGVVARTLDVPVVTLVAQELTATGTGVSAALLEAATLTLIPQDLSVSGQVQDGLITCGVDGPTLTRRALAGPARKTMTLTGPLTRRRLTGPALEVVSAGGPTLGAAIDMDGPAVSRDVTGPATDSAPTISSGPDTSRELDGPALCAGG